MLLRAAALLLCASVVLSAGCPFHHSALGPVQLSTVPESDAAAYVEAVKNLDWDAVKKDIVTLLTDSQPFWPADSGHYGGFFVRQAWHCTGSYRFSDGHGGCDGGRQRFDPELSWADNTNLDKAKKLLWPIKQKYGLGLSWGDLMTFTGTVAIEAMGGPMFGFCAGRVDDADGSASELLGPTPLQNATYPCLVNGECKPPLGTTTIGLIYVNPEGPMGNPDPVGSVVDVRDTFARMGMDDYETVALIGGGHAFGKAHGACPLGPGPSPMEQPSNPWPGMCGTGKGNDTFTSGIEGPWSATPSVWSNNYFASLVDNDWTVHIGPGGKHQWKANDSSVTTMMMTSDIALLHDPVYTQYAHLFATNLSALNDAFGRAWYKLMTRDMGPVTRCLGPMVPPAQPFQNPLPSPPAQLADFNAVKTAIIAAMTTNSSSTLPPDVVGASPYYGAVFVQLAYQCAATYRSTDYQGGCNGARIRFSPEKDWPVNAGLDKAVSLLAPIKTQFGAGLSWADLIVLAGTTALEQAGGITLPFCGGRTDATDSTGSGYLSPQTNYSLSIAGVRGLAALQGLSLQEAVVLAARLRSPGQMARIGYSGTYAANVSSLSNGYFTTLLGQTWTAVTVPGSGETQYQAQGQQVFVTPADMALAWDPDLLAISQQYAANNTLFLSDFAAAWTKLMNADRFAGPAGNVCASPPPSPPSSSSSLSTGAVAAISVSVTAVVMAAVFVLWIKFSRTPPKVEMDPLLSRAG